MSARRERPPSGRVHRSDSNNNMTRPTTAVVKEHPESTNFSARDRPMSGRSQSSPNLFNKQRPASSSGVRSSYRSDLNSRSSYNDVDFGKSENKHSFELPPRGTKTEQPASGRSESSELSTNEILRRMREKSDVVKDAVDLAAIDALGGYNEYSRPLCSSKMPLRTVLLDPEINNFPRSRTRTELMKKIKASGVPHKSYDLDMDGYVSQHDYRLAKRFDFDGNGVLDPGERHIGKQILADEFFKRHAHDLFSFGGSAMVNTSHKQNVQKLVNSYSFERSYDKLMKVERKLVSESSEPILACMRTTNVSEDILKHNYFTNKFDSTAWNDLEAIPRAVSTISYGGHAGSRKKLLFARTENLRNEMQNKMETMPFKTKLPVMHAKRINLITDVTYENS